MIPAHSEPVAAKSGRTWTAGTLTYTRGGLIVLFLLLLWGDFAWAMRDRSVMPLAQWYLKSLEVHNLAYALLISSFPAALGLLLGPVVSYKSDRHRGPRGRRIPFLLATTPIAVFGMVGLALTPVLAPALNTALGAWSPGKLPCELICFSVFWAAFEGATVASMAVFGGLINDVVPQPLLGRFYALFRAISLIDGMVFNYWLIGKVDGHFTTILVTIGLFYGFAFTWVCLKVKEGSYPPVPPAEPGKSGLLQGFRRGSATYFKECFSRGYYVCIFVMVTLASLAFMAVNAFMIPYARSLGMSMDFYGKCLSLTFLISLVLSYAIGWLVDLFHPLRVTLVTLIGYVLVVGWAALFARTPDSFAVALVLTGVLSGCYFTANASMGQRLYPRAKFAQFASAAGVVTSLAFMVASPSIGVWIDATGNQYHYAFIAGVILTTGALGANLVVYRGFKRRGGPGAYVAPE